MQWSDPGCGMAHLKSEEELGIMRRAGRVVAEILLELSEAVRVGITTADLNDIADREIRKRGARSVFKGYRPFADSPPFPAVICASVNDQVVHGIPSSGTVLKEGDVIGIDLGVSIDGYVGDAAVTLPVGRISREARRLLTVGQQALMEGILKAREPNRIGDISHAIQSYAESQGYTVVDKYFGHGVGREMHEEPAVPNFGRPGTRDRLVNGMVLAIEPMINQGCKETRELEDGWTVVTADGKISAHFEHTVAITPSGPEILTKL